jgi:hypothetical protein
MNYPLDAHNELKQAQAQQEKQQAAQTCYERGPECNGMGQALGPDVQTSGYAQVSGYISGGQAVWLRPLLERLRLNARIKVEAIVRTNRAIDILERHPEFDELLELQDLLSSKGD